MGHMRQLELLMQRALDYELLNERQFQEVWAAVGSRTAPVEDVKKQLLRGEYMTNYQLERLAKGERSGFFYGPYKVLYFVGEGTFARVFRAVHRQTGEIVALKVLRKRSRPRPRKPDLVAKAALIPQFMREGKLGLMLRHPNIVPIYEVASEGKSPYLVMEFVEGWNLRDLVRIRTKIEPLQATQLMMGMVEGLRYAFEHGLTHRDLKLNNVLVIELLAGQARRFRAGGLGRQLRRRAGRRHAQHPHHRLCGPGTGHGRAQGRYPQRHLLHGLHLLSTCSPASRP